MAGVQQYPFGFDFQREVLHLAIRNGDFLRESRGALEFDHFTDPLHQAIAHEVFDHFDQYGRPPSKGSLLERLKDQAKDNQALPLAKVRAEVREVWGLEQISKRHVAKKVRSFASESKVKLLLTEYEGYADQGRQEEWFQEVKGALLLRHPEPALISPYDKGVAERFKGYKGGFKKEKPIPVGLTALNKALLGGVDHGELAVILGLRGAGKSHCLVHFGASAMEKGYRVYHVSMEMSTRTVERRYDQRLLKITDREIAAKPVYYARKMSKYKGLLWVASYPSKTLSPSGLRSMLTRKGAPDLLVVDYGRIMRPDRVGMSKWEEIGDIYAALRDIGIEFQCAVWTASQVNRKGYEKSGSEGDLITLEHISESIQIGDHADIVVTFNQTQDEYDQKQARLWLEKSRESHDKVEFPVRADWSKSLLQERR